MSEWIRNRRKMNGYPNGLFGKKIEAKQRDGTIFIGVVGQDDWLQKIHFNTSDGVSGDVMSYRIIEEQEPIPKEPQIIAKDPAAIAPKLWNAYKDKLNDEALYALREVICGEHTEELGFLDCEDISLAFRWRKTKQNDDFWNDVYKGEYDNHAPYIKIEQHIHSEPDMNESMPHDSDDDMVNNPPHYKQGEIECIDAIKSALTDDEFRGYCKGNALKYIWREKHKGQNESVEKAIWYLNKLLEE